MKFLQILALIFTISIVATAQKAVLSGAVYDANGALIPQAKVTAMSEKGERFETQTNGEGIYVLNLPYNPYNTNNAKNFRIAVYGITIVREHFEKFIIKEFKFVPSTNDKMILDIALDITETDNCGAGGCIQEERKPVKNSNQKVSDKILQRPLEKSPK